MTRVIHPFVKNPDYQDAAIWLNDIEEHMSADQVSMVYAQIL